MARTPADGTAPVSTPPREQPMSQPPPWLPLGVALSAPFLAAFDLFGVNIALPTLRTQLDAGPAALELVISGYALAYGGGLITGGRLGDRFGYRHTFVAGLAAFTVASLLCGVAVTSTQLVVARLLQGMTAAVMVPQVFSLITVHFPASHRGRATGWYGAIAGLGALSGQVLGGLLLQFDVFGLGWRTVFLINVVVGVIALPAAWVALPHTEAGGTRQFDLLGATGSVLAVTAVLMPLAVGRDVGWPWWTWMSLLAAAPIGRMTLRWQRSMVSRGRAPAIDPALFMNRAFTRALGATGSYQLYFASLLFTVTLTVQSSLGASALEAALIFLPQGVLFTVSSLLSGRAMSRFGFRVTKGGAMLAAVGLAVMVGEFACAGADLAVGALVAPLALVGLGNGLLLPPLLGSALGAVRLDQAGAASGTVTTAQQFAGALGVTMLGLVFFTLAGPSLDAAHSAMVVICLLHLGLVGLLVVLARPTGASERYRRMEPAPTEGSGDE